MTIHSGAAKGRDSSANERHGGGPGWVPVATRNYLAHVEGGQTIRELAKAAAVHPSTILRRVRRVESLRDDPLPDAALRRMAGQGGETSEDSATTVLVREALPVLR